MSVTSSTRINFHKGFTLLELMVSVGIMVLILTTIVTNQGTYTSTAALRQIADDISLSLRQAQVYGTSVNQLTPGKFDVGYGIEFRMPTADGSDDAYVFYSDVKDVNGLYNYIYDGSWSCDNECIQKTTLARGNKIKEICYIPLDGSDTPCQEVIRADITFLRPSTDAHISLYDLNSNAYTGVKGVKINLISPQSKTVSVTVYTTGQISVQ